MDCEKFDLHLIDALYDELDELTMAAMKRHMEGCSRCAAAFSGLRATRDVAILPLEEPSVELESRILFAASAAQQKTPWHRKALRGLAWAGSHAMRPQLAMAAVFALVIGSSLLLLRAKPGTTAIGPVSVTERGEPSPDRDEGARGAAPAATAGFVDAPSAMPGAQAGDRSGEPNAEDEKQEGKSGKSVDAQAALADAKAAENSAGCNAALPKYEDVGVRFAGTTQAAAAMWAAANCHKKRGESEKARELYGVLAKRDDYKDRANEALNEASPMANNLAPPVQAATATASAAAGPASIAGTNPSSSDSHPAAGAGKAAAPAAAPKAAAPNKGTVDQAEAKSTPPTTATKTGASKPGTTNAPADENTGQAPGWGSGHGNSAPVKRKVNETGF